MEANIESQHGSASPSGGLTMQTINPAILRADYAVRGTLAALAERLQRELVDKTHQHPFDRVVSVNLGNPQGCGQKPLTFFRQVMALIQYPELLTVNPNQLADHLIPEDARQRAQTLLTEIGSVGAYTSNFGVLHIRKSVANFISKRDGFASSPDDIFLTCGAFEGMLISMTLLSGSHLLNPPEKTGVLLPVPFYPVYRALLITLDLEPIPYALDETHHWCMPSQQAIATIISSTRARGVRPRCIVIINPSNPTGAVHKKSELEAVLDLAAKENLMVLADEVYQSNIFPSHQFLSCKKVLRQLQKSDNDGLYQNLQLISLHSTSKGMIGESGQRGGYFEAVGFPDDIKLQIQKLVTYTLQPATGGQILVGLMVCPPQPGDFSFDQFQRDYNAIYDGLKTKAEDLFEAFSRMPGVECQPVQGAIYHFPRVDLSAVALREAKEVGDAPDVWYCKKLLEKTGVCVVPGSGFGMTDGSEDGRIWFRITFLGEGRDWIERMEVFQRGFSNDYCV
ncbi:putative alanine transaminase [Podospora fimiseda]|uniref:Alanine aminotransferase 1 n=1 Tax=Podospora fimiseda TaxID=252190 RepID=A0AAN7BLT4_9PEZI|nr:putative alanine transaminase [Podospora fimiseda]